MKPTRPLLLALVFGLVFALPPLSSAQQLPIGPPLSAEDIMARVAANQDQSESARAHFVYVQHAHMQSRKGKTIMCEETTDFRVTPSSDGSQQQLLKLDGRLLRKHKYITYTTLEPQPDDKTKAASDNDDISINIDDDTDRDLVEHMRNNLTNTKSKDGIGAYLFPLTSKSQADYQFHLIGREPLNGRDTFHLTFSPKDPSEFGWKGDAYIDASAFQPVLVRTAMARNIPFAVRTLLGTSVPGLGFSVAYAPQPDGVWFPTTFGTEFKLPVLFFFSREIVLDAQNRDFEKTHTSSEIVGGGNPVDPVPQP